MGEGGSPQRSTPSRITSFTVIGCVHFSLIAAESFGAIALILGFMTRFCAFGILCDMTGAIFIVHLPYGFFMNWFGKQPGEGFEYHLLVIGIALALMLTGGGRLSADRLISEKLNSGRLTI